MGHVSLKMCHVVAKIKTRIKKSKKLVLLLKKKKMVFFCSGFVAQKLTPQFENTHP